MRLELELSWTVTLGKPVLWSKPSEDKRKLGQLLSCCMFVCTSKHPARFGNKAQEEAGQEVQSLFKQTKVSWMNFIKRRQDEWTLCRVQRGSWSLSDVTAWGVTAHWWNRKRKLFSIQCFDSLPVKKLKVGSSLTKAADGCSRLLVRSTLRPWCASFQGREMSCILNPSRTSMISSEKSGQGGSRGWAPCTARIPREPVQPSSLD